MITKIINKNIKISNFSIRHNIKSRHITVKDAVVVNDNILLKSRDLVEFICNECSVVSKEFFNALKPKILAGNIICKKCKTESTNLLKYGLKHHISRTSNKDKIRKKYGGMGMASNILKQKIESTNISRYGTKSVLSDKDKMSLVMKNKYGVDNISQLDSVKEKVKQTVIERYGVDNISQLGSIKEKVREKYLNKLKIKSFNSKVVSKREKTVNDKYGVSSVSQVPEIHKKQMSSRKGAYKIKIINENLSYQSKPELEYINYCRNKGINIYDGPSISYILNDKKHTYYIDFETDLYLIEIKSSHGWYKQDLVSGKIEAKNKAAIEYAKSINKEFLFILDKY